MARSNAFAEILPPSSSGRELGKWIKRSTLSCVGWFISLLSLTVLLSSFSLSYLSLLFSLQLLLFHFLFNFVSCSNLQLSSTPTKSLRYDVFINHRGPDTKQTLAFSIYHSLKPLGLQVFLDEPELEFGDSIPYELQHAITTSFLHIAIFSPRYAESPWCLEELSLMLKTGHKIIPVFYNVDPSDFRWLKKEAYVQAFSKHQQRYSPQKIQEWKEALQEVSMIKGHTVKNEEDKRMFKEDIVSYVLEHPKRHSFVVAEHPVGLDEISQDFERSVISSKDVKIVGITGMGGCGKTTLAKHYYNKKKQSFYRCSFISDIRDTTDAKMCKMQKKLFRTIGSSQDISFASVEEGKAILAEYLRYVQVFIILDNVDHVNQLNSLLPMKDNINPNSIIVVTCRDSSILKSWGIPSDCIYKMKGLNTKHSMELFCWHAFRQLSPIDEFEYLVEKFLKVCQGLPLSLQVLGRLVHGESKEFWDDQLNQLSRLLPKDIKSILKVSFDALDKEAKEVFLDISCFFTGTATEIDSVITLWDGSGWSGLCSLKTLVNKCLVEVDERNRIKMHDQLKDLGRQIAETWRPYRLWSHKQIDHIEEQGEKILPIRGIKAETDDFYEDFMKLVRGSNISTRRLEILDVETNCFREELAAVAEPLIWLRWGNFPHTALPSWISLKKLRVLELKKASKLEQLWSETADPPMQLRVLKIFHAENFLKFPRSIGFLKELKKITFDSIGAPMEGLPEEFCLLQSLECLNLFGCHNLKSLPTKFGDLTKLQELKLSGCIEIESLPEGFCLLQSLETLHLFGCGKLKSLPTKFGNLTKLQELWLWDCIEMESLPEEFCRLQSLESLSLTGCHKLKVLPTNFGNLTKLQFLWLSNINFCTEHTEMVIQPGLFSPFRCLATMDLSRCPVSRISISPQCWPCLGILDLSDNHNLVEIGCLPTSVRNIILYRCSKLESIRLDRGLLAMLHIEECGKLRKIEGLERCGLLHIVNVEACSRMPLLQSPKGLQTVRLRACDISAFEASLQGLDREKWPNECGICCSTAPGMEAIIKSFASPALTLVDLLDRRKFPISRDMDDGMPGHSFGKTSYGWSYVFSEERSSSEEAVMVCLVINSPPDPIALGMDCGGRNGAKLIEGKWGNRAKMVEGKWVYIGVSTGSCCERSKVQFNLWPEKWRRGSIEVDCVEMGLLAMGEDKMVVNAFYQLLQRLGSCS